MSGTGRPALFASLICFGLFFGNVTMGALRMPPFLGDVAEMLTLFAASLLFVAGVLQREARDRTDRHQPAPSDGHTGKDTR